MDGSKDPFKPCFRFKKPLLYLWKGHTAAYLRVFQTCLPHKQTHTSLLIIGFCLTHKVTRVEADWGDSAESIHLPPLTPPASSHIWSLLPLLFIFKPQQPSFPADRPHVINTAVAADRSFCTTLTWLLRKCFIWLLEHRGCVCMCLWSVRTFGSIQNCHFNGYC